MACFITCLKLSLLRSKFKSPVGLFLFLLLLLLSPSSYSRKRRRGRRMKKIGGPSKTRPTEPLLFPSPPSSSLPALTIFSCIRNFGGEKERERVNRLRGSPHSPSHIFFLPLFSNGKERKGKRKLWRNKIFFPPKLFFVSFGSFFLQ